MNHKRYCGRPARQRAGLLVLAGLALSAGTVQAYNPLVGDYSKEHSADVRVMAYNHARNFISNTAADPEFNRILAALDPDVICFEEFTVDVSASVMSARLNSVLPIAGGGSWQVQLGLLAGVRTVIASRYPLTLKRTDTIPASATRGVTIALVNLPDDVYPVDLYLLGVHLKCCGDPGGDEDADRQDSADAIANWLGDARGVARASGNNIVLPAATPMIVLGDFNLVGGPQPGNTLVTGDIQDNATYGADVKGDWDNTNLLDLLPADPFNGSLITWQGSGSFPPSTLDHMFYTDSALVVAHSFVFNTNTMSPAARSAAGVLAGDTLPANASDHLPIVADLRLVECAGNSDCADGDPCNGDEICAAGSCGSGLPLQCADTNPCTDDACTPGVGCTHTDNSAPCDDADACTIDDVCAFGACGGPPRNCADGLFCNGAEICISPTGCLNGAEPCNSTDWCDELDDACIALGDGDFDGDHDVDLRDFSAFQRCLGQGGDPACAPANIVGADATIDATDLVAFIALLDGA